MKVQEEELVVALQLQNNRAQWQSTPGDPPPWLQHYQGFQEDNTNRKIKMKDLIQDYCWGCQILNKMVSIWVLPVVSHRQRFLNLGNDFNFWLKQISFCLSFCISGKLLWPLLIQRLIKSVIVPRNASKLWLSSSISHLLMVSRKQQLSLDQTIGVHRLLIFPLSGIFSMKIIWDKKLQLYVSSRQ
jgi:hypothetical protein